MTNDDKVLKQVKNPVEFKKLLNKLVKNTRKTTRTSKKRMSVVERQQTKW